MYDVQMSPLALGTMLFGTRTDATMSFSLLDRYLERGGRWIDTADCYAFWLSESGRGDDSERVVGEWLARREGVRDEVLISTKVGAEPTGPDSWRGWPANREGLSRQAILNAVDGSLARLGVDRIDLLWLHQEDRSVPIEESIDALAELADRGTIDRAGASNHPAWLVERARHTAAADGLRFDAVQLAMTYLRVRPWATPEGNDHPFGQASREQLDHATETAMEVWAYTPLLRGAYDDPARQVSDAYEHPGTVQRLSALSDVAADLGAARGQVVLAWLITHGVRPIIGASTIAQLDEAMDAVDLELTPDQLARLDGVAP